MKSLPLKALAGVLAVSFASSFNPVMAAPAGDPVTACELERSIAMNFMSMRHGGMEKDAVVADMQTQLGGELDEDTRRVLDNAYEVSLDDDEDIFEASERFAESQFAECLDRQPSL